MIKTLIFALWMLLLVLPGYTQRSPEVLATIGPLKVYTEDFKLAYERNNGNITDLSERKSPSEYLQLYFNFKLKVLEAQSLGLDTLSSFRRELAGYRADLAAPYLTDLSYENQLVEDTYRRLLNDINASHLLIALPEQATPADTLKAWLEINRIADEIASGLDFPEAARRYSQDPSVAVNSGSLGWFTAFQMVSPFEDAAYNTPAGRVSSPIRTRFGYHLLKVNETREAMGEIKVAHIMKRFPPDMNSAQKAYIRRQIDSLYLLSTAGEDFSRLARENSEDDRSAVNGGELPYFGRSIMIPSFSDPAFALASNGDISKPLETEYGFHILKRIDLKPIPSLDEIRPELINRIKRDPERLASGRSGFIQRLKLENGYQAFPESLEKIIEQLMDLMKLLGSQDDWRQLERKSLFSLSGIVFDSQSWLSDLLESQSGDRSLSADDLHRHYRNWEESQILAREDVQLEEKYPSFRSLYQEYHDGILLFDVMERVLWQPAVIDTLGLERFYENNKARYLWDERFEGVVVQCTNREMKDRVLEALDQGVLIENLENALGLTAGDLEVVRAIWQRGDHAAVDYVIWNGALLEGWNEATDLVWGTRLPPMPKSLDEARGFHLADYQQSLEEQWLQMLRSKYPVVINKRALRRL